MDQWTEGNSSELRMPEEIRSEVDDEVRIILPSSNYKELQTASRIPHGIVISGEASESDEEIDTHHTLPQSGSDFSINDSWDRSSAEPVEKDASREGSAALYNTLLHKKLREKNQTLRRNIVELVTQPYESASKEIHNISQQLIKSQLLVQELRNTIRRLTNDLFDMEDKMEALRTGSFLPDIYEPQSSD
ncbi:biogenesis of lysosome-related organelles complex 1 subunit 3-like isoform X2 [Stegodyphus dumicola]|uniref:biogenesis of lysosome-related organelles complex 1 subunit 3-like isoform X2 n=1 Tax=Stegodyphus dumicola TaxID=202533 RepID=UPI0015B1186A|nr:biogenesis of lysosome-related organelles complex 1 subunit 3-like isoform X2 [Stegodyphus dumicola]